MPKIQYEEGKLVGESLYLKEVASTSGRRIARFVCRCGNIFDARIDLVKSGSSCGCVHLEKITTHGETKSKEYLAWRNMVARCYNVNYQYYELYGGRGIKVCDRWLNSFENFLADVGKSPTAKHSADRFPNKDGNYEPNNFRWATQTEQIRNRNSTILVEYLGIKKPLIEWCEDYNLNYKRVQDRITNHGYSPEQAFFKPPKSGKNKLSK